MFLAGRLEKPNFEARNPKECRNPNAEEALFRASAFVIDSGFWFRDSRF